MTRTHLSGRLLAAARSALAPRTAADGAPPARAGELLLALARSGPAPLEPAPLGADPSDRGAAGSDRAGAPLRLAAVVPSFRRGSGGHATIVALLRALAGLGHSTSVWLEDSEGRHRDEPRTLTESSFRDFFGAGPELEVHASLDAWSGADVVLATGWQTVARALLLPGCRGRAYLVQDHEPDFYASSAESLWAAQSYGMGLHCIAASAWLAELLRTRYGARATHFDLALDHSVYHAGGAAQRAGQPAERGAGGMVAFYARAVTPRRAVPIGLLALEELARRRPGVEIALFGEDRALGVPFEHRALGVLGARELAGLYRSADVGMVLSLSNPSLVCLEMMACGLPCVELASEPMLATFGTAGTPVLAGPDPLALCDAIEALLDDRAGREHAAARGLELMAERTWEHAAMQVQRGVRQALRASSGDATERAG